MRRRTELVALVNALARVLRDRVASRMVRRPRFGAFGTGSIIEPPFRVVSADRIHIGRDVRIRPNAWFSVVANERGTALKLSEEELAFYDALETNDSAVQVLGDETLRTIAREVTDAVRKNVTIDWTMRENVRAQLRVIIKRILRKYGYPPDKQEKATQTVLEQVELLGWEVAA